MKHDRALARWREAEAIRLRLEGLNYHAIARALGYRSRASAWKAVDRALRRTTAANVEAIREEVLLHTYVLEKTAWAAACAGKRGAIYETLRALDQRARIVGLYREGKPDWDGVKQPVQRNTRPRPRSTWVEPRDALKPYGLEGQGGLTGLDYPNQFIVLKGRQY